MRAPDRPVIRRSGRRPHPAASLRPSRWLNASGLGLALAIGSAAALLFLDDSHSLRLQAQAALDNGNFPRALNLYWAELRQDSASPYRWADLAEAYAASGDIPNARLCFERARRLGPHIPPIWIRDANFHWGLDEPAAALSSSSRVLETVPDYDDILFTTFDRLPPSQVLAQIGPNKRATISWFRHLLIGGNVPSAQATWRYLVTQNPKYSDDELAAAYIDFLLRAHLYDNALQSWTEYLGPRGGEYPAGNLLFNGDYKTNPTGAPFDWRILPSDKVDTVFNRTPARAGNPPDSNSSIHITFHGDNNVAYEDVAQTTRVHPGPHRLRAWIRTVSLTTNEGLRLRVYDPESPSRLNYETNPLTGTQDWTLIDALVIVPDKTNLVVVQILRHPSTKFDNKIAGEAWIKQVSLTRVHP